MMTREWGKPFSGYMSSVPPHMAPPDKAVGREAGGAPLTQNLLFDPQEGAFFTRGGTTTTGGASGVLETGNSTSLRARVLREIRSPSIEDLGDGYPTHAVLFTRESATAAENESALYLRSTIGPIDYTWGQEWSQANHYAYTTPVGSHNFKVVPYMRTTDGVIGRLNTAALRRAAFAGSRGMLEVGSQLCLPCKDSLPQRINKRYNESDASGAQNMRQSPLGHLPPPPMLTAANGTQDDADGSWVGGDFFYISVQFEFADGSVSPYAEPRDQNDQATSGIMRITVTGASTTAYRFMTISGIPIGPDGCVARRILRTPKRPGATPTAASPAPRDLRLAYRIGNNTDTTLQLTDGNDLSLKAVPLTIRDDNILCPPGRYMWQADNRIFVGYTKRNPAAVVLWPNVNTSDDVAAAIANIYEVSLATGTLTLRMNNAAVNANRTFTADDTITLQQLVDAVNADNVGGAHKWWAAVAPGADAQARCSAAAGANDNLASTTGVTTGDENYAATARIRSYCTALPMLLFYSVAWLGSADNLALAEIGKRRFFFTMGGPGMPTNAANSWSGGTNIPGTAPNYRTAPDSWGILMGGAPLLDGCVIFFSKMIAMFRNTKSGKSGLDSDYELLELFPGLGCIAWDSIFSFGGVAGCLTTNGILITDGTREGKRFISGDVWNRKSKLGEWDYEIKQSIAAISKDSDASHFHAEVFDGELICTYRRSSAAASGVPERMIRYDFSASSSESGLRGWLQPDGSPWGWSAPSLLQLSVMGEVGKSDKKYRFGVIESNLGTTPGRVDEFDTTSYADNGNGFTWELWTARDYCGQARKRKRAVRLTTLIENESDHVRFNFYRDSAGTASEIDAPGATLPASGQDKRFPAFLPPRGGAPTLQARYSSFNAPSSASKIWGAELEYEEVDSPT